MNVKEYIRIEETLTRRLQKHWAPIAAEFFAPVVEALEAGDFVLAKMLADEIDLASLAAKSVADARVLLRSAALFGAKVVSGKSPSLLTAGGYEKVFERLSKQLSKSVEANVLVQVHGTLLQLIAKRRVDLTRPKPEKLRPAKEYVTFKESGDSMLQMIASMNTSRLATWGFTVEADLRGITEYKLKAVLDGRTSDFCRLINGKKFKVIDAKRKVVQALNVSDPNDLKNVAPWPKQTDEALTKYASMTSEELVASGFLIPPFHPGCRTLCALVTL